MDCDIDIDLVHFEIMYGALARISSSKRLFKIAGLLGAPQAILFQFLYSTLDILLRLSVFRRCYFSVPRFTWDVDSSMLWSLLVVVGADRLSSNSNDQHKTADCP